LDQTMENIRIGMEVCRQHQEIPDDQENIFKFNQRRLACVKYLGELYMYRAVSAAVIFDTLWSLISFGHRKHF
jgi:regulator of nonsense transcripts 2